MSSKNDIEELIRRKTLLGSQLSGKDKDYIKYTGGSFETSSKIALIDFIIESELVNDKTKKIITLYRNFLDLQRKAFFVTVDSDILTKLAILVGSERNIKSGIKPAN
jgi:hypothetical protein